jgi:nicotinate phosphoribosyltransferase
MKYGLTPIGTMAHEFLQAPQALVKISDSQKCALEAWSQEYRGDLGIALTDVLGVDAFLKDFDLFFSKLFDGVRHDSGNPIFWMNKILSHYKTKNIDPTTKIAVFSDGLTVPKAIDIYNQYKGQMKMLFAIGTNLTNDVGPDPLNIVIKMTGCNDQPVAKISDSGGKQTCEDERYLTFLRHLFNLPEEK